VMKAIEQGPLAAVEDFIPVQQRLANSEDAAEGVRSFVERRPARFSGR
jgi:enoyl-CoA hydratase